MNNINEYLKTKLKGNVQSVKISYNNGLDLMYQYNNEGLETEFLCFKDGLIYSKRFMVNHENGIDIMFEDFIDGKSLGSSLFWRFDNHERLIYDRGDYLSYDINGYVSKKTRIDKDNNVEKTKCYKYDTKGNKIEKCSYDANNRLYFRANWKYDVIGEVEKYEAFDNNGKRDECFIYIYNDSGQIIEEISFWYENEIKDVDTYEYDEQGNLILWTSRDERLGDYSEFHYSYEFDYQNNMIRKRVITEDEKPFYENTYDYDSNNNLIKKIKVMLNSESPAITVESYDIIYS